jgi:Tfp pilus assembly protein PilX
MKTQTMATKGCPDKRSRRATHPQGFALVVTLSLMILLTVIAVGMLGMASVSLRNSGQTGAMSIARANARMALMLAIGELQKNAGPDQRITARADVLDEEIANPKLTGPRCEIPRLAGIR